MSEPVTDSVLVQRAGRGDSIAFSELVNRHYRRAMRVAFGLVRNTEHAEDVTQEAFARVHARLPEFAGASAFYTWLYRIIVHLSSDVLRRQRSVDVPAPEPLAEQLRRIFADLPTIHQAVLLLRELEGFSYDEIAATLQLKKSVVMNRLCVARRALQARLSEFEGEKKAAPEGSK